MSRTHRFGQLAAALLGVVLVVPAISTSTLAAQDRFGGAGLTVYSDENFSGRSATFRDDVPDMRPIRMNDQATSLQVGRGETWEVCEDINFNGRCQIVSGSASDLRGVGWSDTISSARRVRGGGRGAFGNGGFGNGGFGNGNGNGRNASLRDGIELFTDSGFGGRRIFFDEATPNLQSLNFNDRAMSVRLGRGDAWEICTDANYRNCRVISSDIADLSRVGLSTRISSLRPVSDRGQVQSRAYDRNGRLFLYDQKNFRGQPIVVDGTTASLQNFSGKAESVRVEGGSWEVCSGASFRGRCTVITGDESDLGRIGLRNNVTSARPVARRN
jgi:hypothetical protein